MTVMEALKWANDKLRNHLDVDERGEAPLDSPMLDAEVMLANILDVQKTWLFSHFDHTINDRELEQFRRAIERRSKHEPVAYIIGKKAFYGRDFVVNRFTLIPRPETELLVDAALEIYDASPTAQTCFVDIGTGCGAIAVTFAAERNTPVLATDIDAQALSIARQNARTHNISILFLQGDTLIPIVDQFTTNDALICNHMILCANLPYLTTHQWRHGQEELHYEPRRALVAGRDGLGAYWKLFRQLTRNRAQLPEHVTVLIEIDPSQTAEVEQLVRHNFPHASINIRKDLEKRDRVVIVQI